MKMKQLVKAINDNNPEQVGSLIDGIDTINEPLEKSALHEAQLIGHTLSVPLSFMGLC